MFIEETIKGKYVTLKSANIEDAEFSLELRQNPALTKYLPKLDVTIEQQKNWILDQRNKNDDYFFVVINNKNERIIGIYPGIISTGMDNRTSKYCSLSKILDGDL